MTGEERDRDLIDYLAECIDRIEEYSGEGEGPMAEDAILRRLETLADATGRLSDALKLRHPEIPWPRIVAFRNVLAHGYLSLQRSVLAGILGRDLPRLRSAVQRERERLEPSEPEDVGASS